MAKIFAYGDALLVKPAKVTRDDVHDKTVSQLREMLGARKMKVGGKKSMLVERLLTNEPGVDKWHYRRWAMYTVHDMIRRYGDDGFGDKQKDMCRVEYWIGHITPEDITGTSNWARA